METTFQHATTEVEVVLADDVANTPTVLRTDLLEDLKMMPNWICWRLELSAKGKMTKVPYQADQHCYKASSTEPSNWTTYDNALAFKESTLGEALDLSGLGFVFNKNGYVGIDIDNAVINGKPKDEAQRLLSLFEGHTYIEMSQSKTGYHIICKGCLDGPGIKRQLPQDNSISVEIYDTARYFVMTEQPLPTAVVPTNQQEHISSLYKQLAPLDAVVEIPPPVTNEALLARDELYVKYHITYLCLKDDFSTLWNADFSRKTETVDRSSKMLSLANKIAWYYRERPSEELAAWTTVTILQAPCWNTYTDKNTRSSWLSGVVNKAVKWAYTTHRKNELNATLEKDSLDITCISRKDPVYAADRFVKYYQPLKNLIYYKGSWYQFNDVVYDPVDNAEVYRRVFECSMKCKRRTDKGDVPFRPVSNDIDQFLFALKNLSLENKMHSWRRDCNWNVDNIHLTIDDIEKYHNQYIVGTNGVFNITATGELKFFKESTPDFFTTFCLPFDIPSMDDYNEEELAPWLDFLQSVQGHDSNGILALQEWFGYCLTTSNRFQRILFLVGAKGGGKGTIVRALKGLIGRAMVGSTLNSFGNQFALAKLLNANVCSIPDARLGSKKNDQNAIVERLLAISGDDEINVDIKNKDEQSVKLTTKLILTANEIPLLTDSAAALTRRLLTLTFNESFEGKENPQLGEQIESVRGQLFLWAIKGLQRLYKQNGFTTPGVTKSIMDEFKSVNSPLQAFFDTYYIVDKNMTEHLTKDEVFRRYCNWSTAQNNPSMTQAMFGRYMYSLYPWMRGLPQREAEGERRYIYTGIKYKIEPKHQSFVFID